MPAVDAILFFIGGALTLGAGIAAERYRDKRHAKRLLEYLKQALRDDLERAIETYDQLLKVYITHDFVSYAHTQAIQDSRTTYDRNRDAVLLLDSALRRSVIEYYLRSSQTLAELVNAQQRKDAVDKMERELFVALIGKNDPATNQPYANTAAMLAAAQAQMPPHTLVERTNAMNFIKTSISNNVGALTTQAKAILTQLKAA